MSEALAAGPTAGALLRQAREAAGLHVAALAVSLKVPVRKLEALEDDRYDQLPDAVFARALASSVCRNLKIDPQPVLDRLPQTTAPRLVQDHEGIGAPFRAPGDVTAPGWREHLMRPVSLAVGALLLGAVAILLLPSFRLPPAATAKADVPAVPMAAAVVVPADPANAAPPAAADPAPTASAAAASVAPNAAPATAAMPSAMPAPTAVAATLATTPATTPAEAPVPTTGIVVFKATGPSWVQVTDAKGNVTLRRLMAAGETAGASGALPLAVTVGSVNVTAVEVRGKSYDLGPVSRDNVARFEIK
jgi:cytoskeleton protein RodZ